MLYFKEDIPAKCDCCTGTRTPSTIEHKEGCKEDPILFMHSFCHPQDPAWCYYDHSTGLINVICAKCESHIFTTPMMTKQEYVIREAQQLLNN